MNDYRTDAAYYYDLSPSHPDDVPFYLELVDENTEVLELGCGTGRVLVPLAQRVALIHGVDHSEGMMGRCRRRLADSGLPADNVRVVQGDITQIDMGRRYDLVTAPFRVMQNLETDQQLDGLFDTIRRHLRPEGSAVLCVFHPNRDRETMLSDWVDGIEHPAWELETEDGRITCHDLHPTLQSDPLIIYPELVYRRYQDGKLVGQAILRIAMRCYYPDEFQELIRSHGFRVLETWGGYHGEPYGQGPELVVRCGPS